MVYRHGYEKIIISDSIVKRIRELAKEASKLKLQEVGGILTGNCFQNIYSFA